ncbi:MAG: SPOR domain-containing protein [Burkholderiaceae bacterium]
MQNFTELTLSPWRRQAGGTVLGLIVGLIIGLGIAVVVAVMITKSSLPFTNKQAQPERATNGGGSAAVTDPNKPMYGNKEPSREAAKNFARETAPENSVIDSSKPPVTEKSTTDKTKSASEKAVTDAKQAAAKAAQKNVENSADKAAAADRLDTAKPDPAEEKWIYYLQAGAFREPTDAESAKAKLALMGFEANISERPSDNGPLYRVRVGPFRQLEVMTRARGKLSDNGIDVAVVRTAR